MWSLQVKKLIVLLADVRNFVFASFQLYSTPIDLCDINSLVLNTPAKHIFKKNVKIG